MQRELGWCMYKFPIACLHIPIYIILPTIFMLKSKISPLLIGLDVSKMTPGPDPRHVKSRRPYLSKIIHSTYVNLKPLDLLFFYSI